MKRINKMIILSSVLVLLSIIFAFVLSSQEEYEVVNIQCDRMVFDTLSEIEDYAVIVAEVAAEEEQGQEVSSFFDYELKKELPSGGYTKRDMTITKVYKGDIEVGDKLVFLHDYYIWTYDDGRKQLITLSGFKPLQKGEKYLVFLQEEYKKGEYSSAGDYLGLYPVDTINDYLKAPESADFSYIYDMYQVDNMEKIISMYDDVVRKYHKD